MGNERDLLMALTALKQKEEENKLVSFKPHDCQLPFSNTTSLTAALIAGNQVGKTTLVSYMVACHLTGLYPDWWRGIRLVHATEWWAAGVTGLRVRDTIQRKLFGSIGRLGTGMIPKHLINTATVLKKTNVPAAFDRVDVKHVDGGWSNIQFFSYDQGLEKFMGTTLDGGAWCDEEPPADVNTEIKTRLAACNGLLLYSFTPVDGITPLYDELIQDPNVFKHFISQTEVPHLTEEALKRLHAGMSDADLAARRDGKPITSSGKVFSFAEEEYTIEPFEIPAHWRRLGGLDVGGNHPTGALMAAIDDDSKTIYITNEYKCAGKTAVEHSSHLKHWGVKFVIDKSAFQKGQGTLISTASIYQDEGLDIVSAKNHSGSWRPSVEEVRRLIGSGRLYIFTTCSKLLQEMRTYRTKTSETGGEVVIKTNDDLVDPLRYICMNIEEQGEMPKRFQKKIEIKQFRPADSKVGY